MIRPRSPFKANGQPPSPLKGAPASAKGKSKAIYVDVVVEGMTEANGNQLPEAARGFLAGLGDILPASSSSSPRKTAASPAMGSPQRASNPAALNNILNELLSSEVSYVKRLRTLQTEYAIPLKTDGKSRSPAMITTYEANALFGNAERLLMLNESLLAELEPALRAGNGSWAAVLLRHIERFEPYAAYISNYPTAKETEKKLASNPAFVRFCENQKYSPTADVGSAGLRELLAEPFQRIARYPLLLSEILKHIDLHDPLRPILSRASDVASDIARNESGEVARKAAEMHTVASAIADFPPQLLQGGRQYIASIDVKDVPIPITQSIGPSNVTMPTSSANTLHATLLLFNDVIVFAKRSANDRSKQLIGLDRANSVVAPSSGPLSPRKTAFRKDGLQFRGAVALSAVTAVNEGSSLGLHLDDPPAGLSARWVGRPTRRYIADANDKRFFLDKLWRAQAAMRLRPGATTVLSTSLSELAKGAGLGPAMDDAHVYFTIFSRAEWDREADKGKAVVRLISTDIAQCPPAIHPLDKPHAVLDAAEEAAGAWRVDVRQRGTLTTAGDQQIMTDALLAYEAASTVFRLGMADVPPRYPGLSLTSSPVLGASKGPTSSSGRLQSIAGNFNFGADGHRRTKSTASKASSTVTPTLTPSIFSAGRTSTVASSLRSGSIVSRHSPLKASSDADMEVLAPASSVFPRSASADSIAPSFDGQPLRLARSQSDQSMQTSHFGSPSRSAPAADVFGPTSSPTSPRTALHGPRPSPSQRRKPVPQALSDDVEMIDSSDAGDATIGSLGKRPRDDTPLSPGSDRTRKRPSPAPPIASPPQRANTSAAHSPAVRSPLGRQTPRRALTERQTPDRVMRELDDMIADGKARVDSMQDLRSTVKTFALPPGTPKDVVSRSRVGVGSGLTRSPVVYDIQSKADPELPPRGSVAAFKMETEAKLEALLGEWELSTQSLNQIRAQVAGHEAEKKTLEANLVAEKNENASLKRKLERADTRLREQTLSQAKLDAEVKEIYKAVNNELDRMFDDNKLPQDERTQSLERDVKRHMADKVLLKYRISELEAQLASKSSA